MADNFRSVGAFKAWVWSYVPVVGGASAWSTIVFLMVMHFVASCVEQFAQSQASYEHNKELMQVLGHCSEPPPGLTAGLCIIAPATTAHVGSCSRACY